MADISFYKYLETAFRYRLNDPLGKVATPATKFNYLGYNFPYNRIFYYARRVLPKFYTNEFPNTEEGNLQMARSVLEKLEKHKDPELENQFKGLNPSKESQLILQEAVAETQTEIASGQISGAEPVGSMAGGHSSMPHLPSTIHNVPHAPSAETPTRSQTTSPAASQNVKAETPAPKIIPANKSGVVTGEHSIPSSSKFNFSAFKSSASNYIKKIEGFASPAGPFLKIHSNRIGQSLGKMVKGIGRGIVGPGLSGGANFLGRAGLGTINRGGNFLSNVSDVRSRLSATSKSFAPQNLGPKKAALAFIGVFLLFIGIGVFGDLMGTTPISEANPIGAIGSDISSCKFTRGGDSVKELTYKSPLLLSYIQEAANLTNIPPVVLAAFIRVESPSVVSFSDEQTINYRCIKDGPGKNVSSTGALGVMQIQPPGTTSAAGDPASCDDCIDAGAKLVGKTVSTMTIQDYCDPRTNIIVGAGWILKKMNKLGYGDGTKWDPSWTNDQKAIKALVNTYYGDVLYPDVNSGPFNYADDVSTSIQNCQTQTPPPPGNRALATVLQWTQAISNNLDPNSTDRLLATVTNGSYSTGVYSSGGYACTYLVADSYNLAGISGLNKADHGWVGAMENFWRSAAGYSFLDYQQNHSILKDVQPGFAMFQQKQPGVYTGNEHVSIVAERNIDSHGNGHITTLDSNSGKYRGWTYAVDNWIIKNNFTSAGEIITGFGGH